MKQRSIGKVFVLLFAVLGLCAALLAFGACSSGTEECKHEHYTTATTATCEEAGETTYTCSDCGTVFKTEEAAALGHDYKVTGDSVRATCSASGTVTYKCSRCDASYSQTEPQLTHNYVVNEEESVAATCLSGGKTVYECTLCHDSYSVQIAASGHAWSDGAACEDRHCTNAGCDAVQPATAAHEYTLVSDTATCTADGVKTYECLSCGKKYTETSYKLGHDFTGSTWTDGSDWKQIGDTCTYEGTHSAYCNRCMQNVSESCTKVIHDYKLTVTKEATCTQPGTKEMKCSVCGEKQADSPAVTYTKDHNWDAGEEQGDGSVLYACRDCSATKVVYTGTTATVDKDQLANSSVSVNDITVTMDEDSVAQLPDGESLNLSAESKAAADLDISDELKEQIGDSAVYDISLSGQESITQFGGSVTVRIPYELKDGENESEITIWYINGSGEVELIENAVYDGGFVTFTTEHFSYYTVGKYTTEQICAKYGHSHSVAEAEATCVTAGYTIDVCARCGKILQNDVTPALGHDFELNPGSTQPTCEKDGSVSYTCSRCNQTHTVTLPKLNHTWAEQDRKEATCTESGYVDYKCETCSETYREDIPALSHLYKKTVTAPTCVAQGYTTYTCTRCQDSYVADYKPATGHIWNIDAPTCGEGQVCTVCGEKGLPATGAHNMADSVCTVCGQGCNHAYAVQNTVAATCTEGGYTVYKCSKCGGEKIDDYTSALGHVYQNNFAVCDRCGDVNPQMEALFGSMRESLQGGKYALTVENFTFAVSEERTVGGETTTYDAGTLSVERGRIYFSEEKGKTIISLAGEGTFTNADNPAQRVSVRGYGDGEYLYLEADAGGMYGMQYMRMSYEELPAQLLQNMTGGSSSQFSALLGVLSENVLPLLEEFSSENSSLVAELAAKLFAACFAVDQTESGYAFTADLSQLKELNEKLNSLGVAALVDDLFGSGVFDKIKDFVFDLLTEQTVRNAADTLLGYAEDYGVSAQDLFSAVDAVIECITGEAFDVQSFLDTPEFAEMTFAEFFEAQSGLEPGQFQAQLDGIVQKLKSDVSVYETIFGGETAPQLYAMLAEVLDGDFLTVTIATDVSGAVEDIELKIEGFEYTYAYGAASGDPIGGSAGSGTVTEFSNVVKIDGSIGLLVGESADIETSDVKRSVENAWAKFVNGIRTKCEESEGMFGFESSVFLLRDGEVYFVAPPAPSYGGGQPEDPLPDDPHEPDMPDDTYEPDDPEPADPEGFGAGLLADGPVEGVDYVLIPLASMPNISYYQDCSNSGYYTFTVSAKDYPMGYISSIGIYYNEATGVFSSRSFHKFVIDVTKPVESEEDVDCGEYWYDYYKCSVCGAEYAEGHYKSHRFVQYVELPAGSETCEDGVNVYEKCIVDGCDYKRFAYKTTSHQEGLEKIVTVPSPHEGGDTQIYVYSCACKYAQSVSFESPDGAERQGCWFDYQGPYSGNWSDEEPIYSGSEEEGIIIGWRHTYECAVSGCDHYMVVDEYDEQPVAGECARSERSVFRFYDASGEITLYIYDGSDESPRKEKNINITNTWESHDIDYNSVEVDADNNGICEEVRTEEECRNCDYGYESVERFDEFGRMTYRSRTERDKDDNIVDSYSYRYEYVSADSCWCDVYYIEDGNTEDYRGQQEKHTEYRFIEEETVQEPTCTQAGRSEGYCLACGYVCEEWTIEPLMHRDMDYDESTGRYICNDCGLEFDGANASIVLEDLTDSAVYGCGYGFTVGYFDQDRASFNVMLYLTPEGSYENTDGDIYIDISSDAVLDQPTGNDYGYWTGTVSIDYAMLMETLAGMGYDSADLSGYDLRVSFVPLNSEYVCSITITDFEQWGASA